MTSAYTRPRPSLSAMLLWSLVLLALGAGGAVWALTRWEPAARFFGVGLSAPVTRVSATDTVPQPAPLSSPEAVPARITDLEARLARVENATQSAVGSAGRADALLIAFAARRAVDRGVPLGYLEALLVDRFGSSHPQAVATVVTASRKPVRLDQLQAEYETLAPVLRSHGSQEGLWQGFKRELGELVTVRRGDTPSPRPNATFDRARSRLASGQVDQALVETMRLPGVAAAEPWVSRARTYVASHRALDELETAALLGGGR